LISGKKTYKKINITIMLINKLKNRSCTYLCFVHENYIDHNNSMIHEVDVLAWHQQFYQLDQMFLLLYIVELLFRHHYEIYLNKIPERFLFSFKRCFTEVSVSYIIILAHILKDKITCLFGWICFFATTTTMLICPNKT
jgi:hypothetical protein